MTEPSSPASPTARRRRLSAELAGLRDAHRQPDGAKTTSAHVADALGWQRSKLSRIENNQWRLPSRRDVVDLLDYYGVTDPAYRDYMLGLVKEGRSKAWWTDVEDLYGSTDYIGLESAASKVRTWQFVVPGLFQTRDYAAAMVVGADIRDPEEVERRVEARMTRQHLLDREDPPQVWAIVDEAAIRKPVGGRDVHRGQLQHLLTLTEAEHLTVQVMLDSAGAHAGMSAPFSMLEFGAGDRPIVHLEHLTESLLLEDPKKTDRYGWQFQHISAAAASPAETVAHLHKMLHDL
jgi:hypothetical protein